MRGTGVSALHLRDVLGQRRFERGEFPLSVGGAGCAIVLAGAAPGVLAYLALQDEQLFIQPVPPASVLHNGTPVGRSTWLRDGDVLDLASARLRFVSRDGQRTVEVTDAAAQANVTAPPIVNTIASAVGSDEEPLAAIQFRAQQSAVHPERTWRVGRLLLATATLLLAGVLWFVFSATSLVVAVEPDQARIEVSGPWPRLALGPRYLLRPGQYRVQASAPGHRNAERTVRVTNATDQRVVLNLAKLPGKLRIDLPEAAQVRADGKTLGVSPGPFELSAGKHRLELVSERYQPFATEVSIEGAGREQRIAPKLVPNWADVSVESEPSGASVSVGGQVRGVTPLKFQLAAGNHKVELQLAGFKPWDTDVQVRATEPLALGPIRLGLPDAKLSLRSEPAGASVAVGGVYRGTTPLQLELRPEIAHSIVFTRGGYSPSTQTVSLKPGEQRALAVTLGGVYGDVTVRADPADAELFVDGQSRGRANQNLKLVTAAHTIEVRKPGYATFTATVTPREGLPQVIEANLVTQEQSHLARLAPTLRTKSGVELKLMPVGRYTMGSARREPGRRANEAQRDVELKRPYYLGVYEVTNEQFRAFRSSHKAGFVGQHSLDLDRQPAINIPWRDAAAFCNWLSQQEGLPAAYQEKDGTLVAVKPLNTGYRLPTEAEWEWAARRDGAGSLRRYPWGNSLPIPPGAGNFADRSARLIVQDVLPDYEDPYPASAPVGKFAVNPLGLFDMGGNAAEWTQDYYEISADLKEPAIDPTGPTEGKSHVIRGSSWRQSSLTDLRLSARDFGDGGRPDVGFRVARYGDEAKP
jgi:formylglycine-generating enzyme required for sulfatase activity